MNTEQKTEVSNLPLKGSKQVPTMKIIGLLALVVAIAGLNIFLFSSHEEKDIEKKEEKFAIPHQEILKEPLANQNTTLTDVNKNVYLEDELKKVKEQDFIERLQASQNASGGEGASSASMQTSEKENSPKISLSNPNTAFLVEKSNSKAEHTYATHYGQLQYIIGQGKFIFANLSVAINSDLPGQITAIVSHDVYGDQGRKVLIPRGSILIGEYRSGLLNNQSRLFVVWTRVREPNGIDAMLGSEGTDYLGRAGLTGNVDNHFFARFGAATLVALVGAGASTVGVKSQDEANSMSAYRQDVTQALSQQASSMLDQSLNIPPTIHVPQGEKIVVFVNRDLDFSKVFK